MLLSLLLQSIDDATIHDVEWYPLIVFIVVGCMVIAFVILEPKVPVPFTSPRKYIVLDQAYPPVFGILLLWASTATGWTVIWEGIVGTNGVKPYTILILFNALAYLCISVDQTGLFAWLAILISKRAGTNGYRLFFYFFLFEMAMTIVTSNDTVILTLTPIIYYTCVCTNQPPLEFLLKMYYIANIYSMTIFVGSPTNIIIVQAKGLTFFGYLKWMLLPAMVTGFTAYGCSYFLFYDKIRPVFKPMPIEASDALVHKEGAIFGAINLTLVLIFLAIYDQLPGIELWYVGLFFAGIQLAGNIYFYVYHTHVPPTGLDHVMDKLSPVNSPTHGGEQSSVALQPAFSTPAGSAVELDVMEQPTSGNAIVEGDQSDAETAAAVSKLRKALYRKLTIWSAFQAMPWNVVPFAGGMFILVNILRHGRWIDLLSQMMRAGDNLPRSVWLWMGVSSGLCNFINDQPTSIVMTYVLVDEKYYLHIPGEKDGDVFSGAIWALSVGTNLGVCFTLIGALAGIMFQKILAEKGLRITYIQYLKVSFWVILPSVIMGAFAVWVELL